MSRYSTQSQPSSRTSSRVFTGGRGSARTARTATIVACVLFAVAIVASVCVLVVGRNRVDSSAFVDKLVVADAGDLPAPPFIGWVQQPAEDMPQQMRPDEGVQVVTDNPDCIPGGEMQNAVNQLIFDDATKWSGTTMEHPAYGATIRIDVTNAAQKARDGVNYQLVDDYLTECDYIEVNAGDKTIRITNKQLNFTPSSWQLRQGRMWATTAATSTPAGFVGATTTIVAVGDGVGFTENIALTFDGQLDENALKTMMLLGAAQSAKATADPQ